MRVFLCLVACGGQCHKRLLIALRKAANRDHVAGSRLTSKSKTPVNDINSNIDLRHEHFGVGACVLTLLIGAALLPVLLVPIPAMVDYPNHLARMYILAANGTADANPYYQVEWALYPNLAMDLIIPRLAHLIGVENAARVFLLLTQVLIISGAIVLEFVVKGRAQLSGFAAVMFLYCLPFTWGFLNFEFALAMALWGIAAMLAIEEHPWPVRLAVNSAFLAALFAAHFFALGIYGAVLGLHEVWRAWQRRALHSETALRLLLLALPAAVALALMTVTGGAIGNSGTHWHFEYKPLWLVRIMNGYSLTVSAACVALLAGWLYLAAKRGALRFGPAGPLMTAGFALLYLAIPSQLFGSAFVDLRVIAAAAFILPAFLSFSSPNRRWTLVALGCAGAITLANLAVVYSVWLSYRADYAAMIGSFAKIDKGALVLVADSGQGDDPPLSDLTGYPMYHAPVLAVHYANAFVPNLFAAAGEQPVRAKPAMRRLDIPYGGPVPLAILTAIAAGKPLLGTPEFIRSWPRDFDYLYVLGPHRPNPMPALLHEVTSARRFVLYRVDKTAAR
jgi:hypothetical protein